MHITFSMQRRLATMASFAFFGMPWPANAAAESPRLPLALANEAAAEAIRQCEADGFHVSVSVIEASGLAKVQLKGDATTPHTLETSYRKAYSIVTFGPNYGLETSAQVAALMGKNPALYQAILTLPMVTPLPGAAAIKVDSEIIGAIGVSGAPGGEKDEACAYAGIRKIASRLRR